MLKHWDQFQGQSVPGYVNLVVNPEGYNFYMFALETSNKVVLRISFPVNSALESLV